MKKSDDGKGWYRILASLRSAYCPDGEAPIPFTIDSMVEIAPITAGEKSSVREMASGYLSTFRKWGYVRRAERLERKGPGRPSYSYVITDSGMKTKFNEPQASKLEQAENDVGALIRAIQVFREADGDRAEAAALKDLLRTADQIVERVENEASASEGEV